MLQAYRDHVAERAKLGIPPLPLTAKQTGELIELLKNPPKGEEQTLVDLITHRVPAGVEVARGDALDHDSLVEALRDCDAAFYLVHSMGSTGSFEQQDRRAATVFAAAAAEAGVRRIVYLGGLGDDTEALSAHLRSRHETGEK